MTKLEQSEHMNFDKVILTRQEVTKRTGIGLTTLDGLLKSGKLRSAKIGRRRVIPMCALVEFAAGLGAS
jgi:excisionase family DNA binding protein